ncbi:ABC transporter ATP-binding protein [Massilia sp. TS11]|uniref:ABC transporter ATP-binding protein n=1 Tax=Massilia sp. TS11 TaxID=2908003 RepID=UPI001EDA816E|nr:ABC transporter ATP-binding protein [Massilia sp. TS11]MCG2586761.1 ABC transporter ATP-binding protein [Massilia sp. TS11]
MANLAIDSLSVTLNGQRVLRELSLQVDDGEFVVLLGPSGCGKSTLLHAIAGLQEVSGGSIRIGGVDMTQAEPSVRGIGMVFQSYALYPTMSVAGNLSFGLRMAGMARAEIAARVARVAAMLELEPLLARRPSQLSGGQRQRVAIGRALVRDAGLFLMDEPLSNLDAQLRTQLRRDIKLLHQRLGTTTVYVTHDQAEAMTLGTRLVLMRAGEIQQIGTPAEVYARPANLFVAGFLGAPPMQCVAGTLGADQAFHCAGLELDLSNYAFAGSPRTGPVLLGVRPEHVQVGAGPLHATVELVEAMGNHQVLWLAAPSWRLAALVHDGRSVAPGSEVALGIDADAVSLFDPDSGMRL